MKIRAFFRLMIALLILTAWATVFHSAAQKPPATLPQPGPDDFMPGGKGDQMRETSCVNCITVMDISRNCLRKRHQLAHT